MSMFGNKNGTLVRPNHQALPIILPCTFLFTKQSDFEKASGTKLLKYGTKFQQALKPNNLFKALKYHLKLPIECVLVCITETLIYSIKHWHCNLGEICHMLHDNDILFINLYHFNL